MHSTNYTHRPHTHKKWSVAIARGLSRSRDLTWVAYIRIRTKYTRMHIRHSARSRSLTANLYISRVLGQTRHTHARSRTRTKRNRTPPHAHARTPASHANICAHRRSIHAAHFRRIFKYKVYVYAGSTFFVVGYVYIGDRYIHMLCTYARVFRSRRRRRCRVMRAFTCVCILCIRNDCELRVDAASLR